MTPTATPTAGPYDAPAVNQSSGTPPAPPRIPPPRIPPPPNAGPGPRKGPEPSEPRTPVQLRPSVVISTLAAGATGDVAFRSGALNTVSMSLFVALTGLALFLFGTIRTWPARAMLLGAIIFGTFLTFRSEPRLIVFDLLAALLLLAAAATFGRDGSPLDLSPVRFLIEFVDLCASWLGLTAAAPADTSARIHLVASSSSAGRVSTFKRVAQGLIFSVPIVVLLGSLLASADLVFASFFSFDSAVLGVGLGHIALGLVAISIVVALQRKSTRKSQVDDSATSTGYPTIGHVEATVVLGSVNLLFLLFAASQLVALTGGAESAMQEAGLTYKDYARQGFFQLLWVAGLTLLTVVCLWTMRRNHILERPEEGQELGKPVVHQMYLSSILTVGIVVVALNRLWLYIDDSGLTPMRFYSSVFSFWILIAFLIVLVRISGFRLAKHWLLPALGMSGLAVLFGLNLFNPEARIAAYNVEFRLEQLANNPDENRNVAAMLGSNMLTADGHTVLVDEIGELPQATQDHIRVSLCENFFDSEEERSWTGYNRSENLAQQAKREFCLTD